MPEGSYAFQVGSICCTVLIYVYVSYPTPWFFPNADPDRLYQIIWNLTSNAIKFTPTDGRVSIVIDADAQQVRIAVDHDARRAAPPAPPGLRRAPAFRGAVFRVVGRADFTACEVLVARRSARTVRRWASAIDGASPSAIAALAILLRVWANALRPRVSASA